MIQNDFRQLLKTQNLPRVNGVGLPRAVEFYAQIAG
jgi:hypothetical protein